MVDLNEQVTLGRSGLKVGRLGISSSFGAPTEAFEEAFERGCNYFTWGTFIKGRSSKMGQAIHNIIAKGQRDKLVLAVYAYSHSKFLIPPLLKRALRSAGTDYIDVLTLGYYQKHPPWAHIDRARQLRDEGLIRRIGLSGHTRRLFPELAEEDDLDVFHVRYNVAHRGAETEVFPHVNKEVWPGVVSFTATRWGRLLKQSKMPKGETAPSAPDCYRFVLSNSAVDVCLMGAKNTVQMRENLSVLDLGPLGDDEMARMRRIGDHVYGKKAD